jgi:conjugative relaxase-like TrwC/TraI family protein
VLRIARLTDRSGRYYLADLAHELGAPATLGGLGPHRPSPGRWEGAGAAGLGLAGAVEADHLAAVLSGRHPRAGHPLRHHPATVAAYDLVFAAPKSVSVLFGLGGAAASSATLEAHRSAAGAALDYVARHAAGVRTGSAEDRRTDPVRGVIAAAFDHGVSRALDPHLHTHVVVANLAQDLDGRWRAVDGRGLHAHARAAGALYDAHLRHQLTERTGAAWVPRGNGAYELAAVDPSVIGALSGRQAEIRQHLHTRLERSGAARSVTPSRHARTLAWAMTRDAKAPHADRTPDALRRSWQGRADAVGWGEVELGRSLAELGPPERRASLDEWRFAAALHARTAHAGVSRREVVAAWAGAVAPGVLAGDVDRCVNALAVWNPAVGVTEVARRRSDVLPSPHALRALGPRPATPEALAVWQSAASHVDRAHRAVDASLARGRDAGAAHRSDLARLPVDEVVAHLRSERAVAEARLRLGIDRAPARRDAGRSIGRG